jgi:hypothetical protein
MAYYLVSAVPRADRLADLEAHLANDDFMGLLPFGVALSGSLRAAKRRPDGLAVWEEEDYCRPPLKEERAAVLDEYFDQLQVERVEHGAGWEQITELPPLFPTLAGR